jgi:hypothetical protein
LTKPNIKMSTWLKKRRTFKDAKTVDKDKYQNDNINQKKKKEWNQNGWQSHELKWQHPSKNK